MSLQDAYTLFQESSQETTQWFIQETSQLRTGRVKASLVEEVPVENYGVRMPLKGIANITNSDARTLVISPWDPTALSHIQKAIVEANIGVQPIVDGKVIRLSFPTLTSEIRAQTIKMLHKKEEEARIRFRQARDEALAILKKDKQTSAITEDDFYDGRQELDKRIDKANDTLADITKKKEQEITTI